MNEAKKANVEKFIALRYYMQSIQNLLRLPFLKNTYGMDILKKRMLLMV